MHINKIAAQTTREFRTKNNILRCKIDVHLDVRHIAQRRVRSSALQCSLAQFVFSLSVFYEDLCCVLRKVTQAEHVCVLIGDRVQSAVKMCARLGCCVLFIARGQPE